MKIPARLQRGLAQGVAQIRGGVQAVATQAGGVAGRAVLDALAGEFPLISEFLRSQNPAHLGQGVFRVPASVIAAAVAEGMTHVEGAGDTSVTLEPGAAVVEFTARRLRVTARVRVRLVLVQWWLSGERARLRFTFDGRLSPADGGVLAHAALYFGEGLMFRLLGAAPVSGGEGVNAVTIKKGELTLDLMAVPGVRARLVQSVAGYTLDDLIEVTSFQFEAGAVAVGLAARGPLRLMMAAVQGLAGAG